MARIIRSQAEDLAKIQAEKEAAKEQEEKARVRLNELSEEIEKIQAGLQQLSKSREEAEQDLEKVHEEEKKVRERFNAEIERISAEKEKKQSEINQICVEGQKVQTELIRLKDERTKLQNERRSAKGVAVPPIKRKIRSVNQTDVEIESIPLSSDSTYLFIPKNSLFIKAKVGDYVSYVGDGDPNTKTWRVWKKTDSSVVITPVLDDSSRQLALSGVRDYLDIVKNAGTQTDKINIACKEWYVNASLGITAENIRSMTVEDINEACGYTVPEIERYAFYPKGTSVSGTITYNGNMYTKKAHTAECFNGCTKPRIYTYDGGGIEKADENRYKYREPKADNPVYVSNTYYYYDPSNYTHVDNNSVTVGSILGSTYGWLASQCVGISTSYVELHVRCAHQSCVSTYHVEDSDVYRYNPLYLGVRPLVFLSSMLRTLGGEGTQGWPWQISK